MAGLERLPIYHERQEEGSMLCAQHALNSLLQGNYFTAPDLSEIARGLDELEESYDDANTGTKSGNMDDSGFFSVQVLDNALKVWGLNLTRWRGEEMRPFHDHPETQLAFILNYEQHWFTLRRFGPHWFNLNSFAKPESVSKLYLGMVLQQAEADGYSVFAVTQADPDPSNAPALPHTEADDIANTIPEPQSSNRPNLHSFASHGAGPSERAPIDGMEDEDYELQAALQASLMGDVSHDDPPPIVRHNVPLPLPESESSSSEPHSPTDTDPVAATMERNRLMLQRMKAEQEYAQRQLWAEGGGIPERDTEEEMIRRAIEESEASARLEGHADTAGEPLIDAQNLELGATETAMDVEPNIGYAHTNYGGTSNRVYDDDDAELQAALKASLEQLPEGWALPEPVNEPTRPANTSSLPYESEPMAPMASLSQEAPQEAETVSVDELRRRRLARFGS
ncbi:Josephin-domain-containing protein [Mycena rebaudengoi]|nr:Josephin-domain-containing protein [Mycena rebaudengoi]